MKKSYIYSLLALSVLASSVMPQQVGATFFSLNDADSGLRSVGNVVERISCFKFCDDMQPKNAGKKHDNAWRTAANVTWFGALPVVAALVTAYIKGDARLPLMARLQHAWKTSPMLVIAAFVGTMATAGGLRFVASYNHTLRAAEYREDNNPLNKYADEIDDIKKSEKMFEESEVIRNSLFGKLVGELDDCVKDCMDCCDDLKQAANTVGERLCWVAKNTFAINNSHKNLQEAQKRTQEQAAILQHAKRLEWTLNMAKDDGIDALTLVHIESPMSGWASTQDSHYFAYDACMKKINAALAFLENAKKQLEADVKMAADDAAKKPLRDRIYDVGLECAYLQAMRDHLKNNCAPKSKDGSKENSPWVEYVFGRARVVCSSWNCSIGLGAIRAQKVILDGKEYSLIALLNGDKALLAAVDAKIAEVKAIIIANGGTPFSPTSAFHEECEEVEEDEERA